MQKQELIHSHILVAIFCGWEAARPNKTYPNGYLRLHSGDGDEMPETVSNENILEELPYGSDWNYLMVAYNEFRDIIKDQNDPENEEDLTQVKDSLAQAILDFNIDLAFKELVRGITMYNQIKIQEHEDS